MTSAADDGLHLLQRLSQLENQSQGAPLVSVMDGHTAPAWQEQDAAPDSHDTADAAGDWEML